MNELHHRICTRAAAAVTVAALAAALSGCAGSEAQALSPQWVWDLTSASTAAQPPTPAPASPVPARLDANRWSPVSDADSQISATLPGTVTSRDISAPGSGGETSPGTIYESDDPPGALAAVELQISRSRADRPTDLAGSAAISAKLMNGTLIASRPVMVRGNPGLEARYGISGAPDGAGIALIQFVATPTHQVAIRVAGRAEDGAFAEQVMERVLAGLRIPRSTATPPPTTTPRLTPRPPAQALPTPAASEREVYREWLARGWVPTPWAPVTDPESGVTAYLLGQAQREPALGPVEKDGPPRDGQPGDVVSYRAAGGPAGVHSGLVITPAPAEVTPHVYEADLERSARRTADGLGGTLLDWQPISVHGRPGMDYRISIPDKGTGPVLLHGHMVVLPAHAVTLITSGAASDDRIVGQVHQLSILRMQIP